LVEASWRLGDRVLHLRRPNVRGDDVAELQQQLGRLGFDPGRVDGIFGPDTADALAEFQRNVGLVADGLCGPETVRALARLRGRSAAGRGVSTVREYERLTRGEPTLAGRRVVVGRLGHASFSQPDGPTDEPDSRGGADVADLCQTVGRALRLLGSTVLTLDEPDGAHHAAAANGFGADVYVGLVGSGHRCGVAYYATTGFESLGGHRLADLLCHELTISLSTSIGRPVGMRLPVLRETRMPAVLIELGPPAAVAARTAAIAASVARGLARWVLAPVDVEQA
jgi:N-acetylmuramoyl-L-alanine amidase